METKDYLTLFMSSLSLLVAAGSYFLSSRTKATTDIVEVVSRKNEIVNEYQAALFLIAECRFYTERLSKRLAEMKAGDDPAGHATATRLVRESLEYLSFADRTTKQSIDRVRTLSPTEITTNPEARKMLEELHGRPQEMKIKLTGMVEQMKRDDQHLQDLGGADTGGIRRAGSA